jgi:FKBP-type peptidyl-prolyl cis-trans isomerase
MTRRRTRFTPSFSLGGEILENRLVMSASGVAQGVHNAATSTSLAVHVGTLGQPTTFVATVRGPASAGAPTGTVELIDHGSVVETLTLSPTSTTSKNAMSQGMFTLTPQPGGPALFLGKNTVTAEFIPSGSFSKSVVNKTFTVSQPHYTTLPDGVKVATIVQGSGPQIQSGQTASMLYTGYLAKNGEIFDDSSNHGGTPFSFTVGAGQVITGFDEGTVGMQAGETRLVLIPAKEGYGSTANESIPANSTLLFVLTLASIS